MTTHSVAYQVNYLLTLSRLPGRFWPTLTGETSIYKNPGTALRSFIVHRCLQDEQVMVEGALLQTVQQCFNFNTDPKVLETIVVSLIDETTELITVAANSPSRMELIEAVERVKYSAQVVKINYDVLTNGAMEQQLVNLDSQQGSALKQGLFDLQDQLGELRRQLGEPDQLA